jgi:hypothetical protein
MTVEAIMKEIRALSAEEQAQIKALLAEESPAPAVPEISPELAKLLDERVAAADANPGVGYTMEEVIAYVKRKK